MVDGKVTLLGVKVTSGAALIVTFTVAEVDGSNAELPEYTATTESLPTANELIVNVACPVALRVTFPSVFVPDSNVTVPAGVVVPLDATNAVSEMGAPSGAVVGAIFSVVVVACFTESGA
jgi:hypothetical protein